jgi:hypothetical protein
MLSSIRGMLTFMYVVIDLSTFVLLTSRGIVAPIDQLIIITYRPRRCLPMGLTCTGHVTSKLGVAAQSTGRFDGL